MHICLCTTFSMMGITTFLDLFKTSNNENYKFLLFSDNFSVEEAIALVDNQLADYSDQRSKYIQSQREINRSTRPTTNGKPSKAAIDNRHDKSDTILTQSFKRPKLGSIENMMLQ